MVQDGLFIDSEHMSPNPVPVNGARSNRRYAEYPQKGFGRAILLCAQALEEPQDMSTSPDNCKAHTAEFRGDEHLRPKSLCRPAS